MNRHNPSASPKPRSAVGELLKWWGEQLAPLPAPARTLINVTIYLWSAALTAMMVHYVLCITGVLPATADFDLGL